MGDGVPEQFERNLREGARIIHDYAKSLGVPELETEIEFHVYNTCEEVIDADYKLSEGLYSKDQIRGLWGNCNVQGAELGDYILINGSAPTFMIKESMSKSQIERAITHQRAVAMHEIVHLYQGNLVGLRMTAWEIEGGAEFLTFKSLSDAGLTINGLENYSKYRNSLANIMKNTSMNLKDLEASEGLRSNPKGYFYSHLAVEYLAHIGGSIDSLIDHLKTLQPGTTRQEQFQKNFGLTYDEFYKKFKEHQEAGFPELETPKNK